MLHLQGGGDNTRARQASARWMRACMCTLCGVMRAACGSQWRLARLHGRLADLVPFLEWRPWQHAGSGIHHNTRGPDHRFGAVQRCCTRWMLAQLMQWRARMHLSVEAQQSPSWWHMHHTSSVHRAGTPPQAPSQRAAAPHDRVRTPPPSLCRTAPATSWWPARTGAWRSTTWMRRGGCSRCTPPPWGSPSTPWTAASSSPPSPRTASCRPSRARCGLVGGEVRRVACRFHQGKCRMLRTRQPSTANWSRHNLSRSRSHHPFHSLQRPRLQVSLVLHPLAARHSQKTSPSPEAEQQSAVSWRLARSAALGPLLSAWLRLRGGR
jgi:hypothetical protein